MLKTLEIEMEIWIGEKCSRPRSVVKFLMSSIGIVEDFFYSA